MRLYPIKRGVRVRVRKIRTTLSVAKRWMGAVQMESHAA